MFFMLKLLAIVDVILHGLDDQFISLFIVHLVNEILQIGVYLITNVFIYFEGFIMGSL